MDNKNANFDSHVCLQYSGHYLKFFIRDDIVRQIQNVIL